MSISQDRSTFMITYPSIVSGDVTLGFSWRRSDPRRTVCWFHWCELCGELNFKDILSDLFLTSLNHLIFVWTESKNSQLSIGDASPCLEPMWRSVSPRALCFYFVPEACTVAYKSKQYRPRFPKRSHFIGSAECLFHIARCHLKRFFRFWPAVWEHAKEPK